MASGQDDCEYSDYSSESALASFKLVVEEKALFVNAGSLAMHSSVFETMCFVEGFKEKEEQMAVIDEEKYEDILEMLRCLLQNTPKCLVPKPIDEANFATIVRIANKFAIDSLLAACEQFIQSKFPFMDVAEEKILEMLAAGAKFGLSKQSLATIIDRAAIIEDATMFKTLDIDCPMAGKVMAAMIDATRRYAQEVIIGRTDNDHTWRRDADGGTVENSGGCNSRGCNEEVALLYCLKCTSTYCHQHGQIYMCNGEEMHGFEGQKRRSIAVDMALLD